MSQPAVTVIVSPREGHFMSERSLLSVLADDELAFELIYIDIASPPDIAQAIRGLAEAHGFTLHRHDDWIAPSLARKQVLGDVKTKYVACVDNDILVERGCLKTLIDCAEETGAGLVCPLYIQVGGGRAPTIHMAGGESSWSEDHELIGERHRLVGAPLAAAADLVRAEADYPEYHYLLAPTAFLAAPDAVSQDILLIHEHLDLALVARHRGLDIIVEPAARATYVAFEPRPLRELAFYRERWSVNACRDSVHAFKAKWLGAHTTAFVENTYDYIAARLQEVELRRPGSAGADLDQVMTPDDLAQSRMGLREQAFSRGYSSTEIDLIEGAAEFATLLYDGLYRPDGRPFLSHAIGTASALVRYELNVDIVQAGLLHAAFTHRPDWMPLDELGATFAKTPGVATLVHGQPPARAYLTDTTADLGMFNVVGAAIATVLTANEIDMRLAGEYRATARPADLSPTTLERAALALGAFGVDGLPRTACLPDGQLMTRPLFGQEVRTKSFRLDSRNRRVLPI
jgi:hypothetical protein